MNFSMNGLTDLIGLLYVVFYGFYLPITGAQTTPPISAGFKGGIPGTEEMFAKDQVFVSNKVRGLLRDPVSAKYRSDFKFEEITVCFAQRIDFDKGSRSYDKFVCPEPDNHISAASYPDLVSKSDALSYCCGSHPYQWCCDQDEFSGKKAPKSTKKKPKPLSRTIIAVIVVGVCVAVLLIALAVFCICQHCCRPQPQQRPMAQLPQQPFMRSPHSGGYLHPPPAGGGYMPHPPPPPPMPYQSVPQPPMAPPFASPMRNQYPPPQPSAPPPPY